MKITFHPQRSDKTLSLSRSGDTLTINGEDFDFANIPESGVLPVSAIESEFIGGPIKRLDDQLYIDILLPHSAGASQACRYPRSVLITQDGKIKLLNGGLV
ncbi:MAG: hypothetical protein P8L68_15345 [Paracoccaceae bacterium]|nr:hypothetical protein [Paracoccaceae bacterium]MDG1738396.1 hypothetical protein [Paracoccaceae bacterium]MDG2259857.1 hypothetical protein [Paracoccaceae bacterium]